MYPPEHCYRSGSAVIRNENTRLLANLHKIQTANKLTKDAELRWIEEEANVRGTKKTVRFPNFSVEMETGTGKTYVYIRTALEWNGASV